MSASGQLAHGVFRPMEKVCPRCGARFVCLQDTGEVCYCAGISLDDAARRFVAENYDDCLCCVCLAVVKYTLSQSGPERAIKTESVCQEK